MMRSSLSNFVIFAVGAAIGSAVTWKLLKTKYEQIAQEEIDSVKEAFSHREESKEKLKGAEPEEITVSKPKDRVPGIREYYEDKVKEEGYVNYSKYETEVKEDVEKPYVIAPDEFGELDGYETISLFYYADKYLTDDDYEIIDDIDGTIGTESLNRFGYYPEDPDTVYVRNDARKTDYEVMLDERNYLDLVPPASLDEV